QLELADLQLVTGRQLGVLDPLAIEVRAVQAAQVANEELPVATPHLGVTTRHRDVVEEDVALGMPARGGHVLVDEERRARVRPTLHYQEGLTRLELLGRLKDLLA